MTYPDSRKIQEHSLVNSVSCFPYVHIPHANTAVYAVYHIGGLAVYAEWNATSIWKRVSSYYVTADGAIPPTSIRLLGFAVRWMRKFLRVLSFLYPTINLSLNIFFSLSILLKIIEGLLIIFMMFGTVERECKPLWEEC